MEQIFSGNWRVRACNMHASDPRNVLGSIPPETVPTKLQTQEEYRGILFEIGTILDDAMLLFERKNKEYGNAIDDTGVLGAVVALAGDVGRLRVLVLQDRSHGRAAAPNVRDKLVDILIQAAIGIYELDKGNWEGESTSQ